MWDAYVEPEPEALLLVVGGNGNAEIPSSSCIAFGSAVSPAVGNPYSEENLAAGLFLPGLLGPGDLAARGCTLSILAIREGFFDVAAPLLTDGFRDMEGKPNDIGDLTSDPPESVLGVSAIACEGNLCKICRLGN